MKIGININNPYLIEKLQHLAPANKEISLHLGENIDISEIDILITANITKDTL